VPRKDGGVLPGFIGSFLKRLIQSLLKISTSSIRQQDRKIDLKTFIPLTPTIHVTLLTRTGRTPRTAPMNNNIIPLRIKLLSTAELTKRTIINDISRIDSDIKTARLDVVIIVVAEPDLGAAATHGELAGVGWAAAGPALLDEVLDPDLDAGTVGPGPVPVGDRAAEELACGVTSGEVGCGVESGEDIELAGGDGGGVGRGVAGPWIDGACEDLSI
jgi:hypothetical protein